MRTRITAVIAVLASTFASAQDAPFARYVFNDPASPRDHVVDMQHMRLELSFVPKQGLVKGKVAHTFAALRDRVDSIFFDGPAIRVIDAGWNGEPMRHRVVPEGIWVFPPTAYGHPQMATVSFTYEAQPKKGMYFIGWNDPAESMRKQIWTQGQSSDTRYWVPCYDNLNDKLITETIVTIAKPYKVLSNGTKLAETENPDGTVTWHYSMTKPHSVYLLMLAIGDYAIEERRSASGLPVDLWYYPQFPEQVGPTYRHSTECIDFMEEHTSVPYPWERYSQVPVADFIYGAMENTTATIFGDFFNVDERGMLDRSYVEVNVHELVHQWFGDLVTARSAADHWLQESFATFYPNLYARKAFGEDTYQWNRRGHHRTALQAGTQNSHPVRSSIAGTARHYPKGAAVLDMLMHTYGEQQYRRAITHYLRKYAYGQVETNDLVQSFQDTLGIDPSWFFDQWIYRGGEPHYEVKWSETQGRATRVEVRQVHQRDHLVRWFRMPINVEIHYVDGSSTKESVLVDEALTVVEIPNRNKKNVAFVLFDPGSGILKQLTFDKPFEELRAQAQKAPLMIDRYDALVALRGTEAARKRALLIDRFNKETFHAVRAEAAVQLLADTDPQARATVRKALRDTDVEVRRATAKAFTTVPEDLRLPLEDLLHDRSYDVLRTALETLCREYPANAPRYLAATGDVFGLDGLVRTKWLEIAVVNGDALAFEELKELSSPSFEFRTRQNAMLALKAVGICDDQVANYICTAAVSNNRRLAAVAVDVLKDFKLRTANGPALRRVLAQDWTPEQRAVLEGIL